MWGGVGLSAKEPLTLQQLFTAENGLKWPEWAESIDTDGKAVWFHGRRAREFISGEIGTGPVIMTLATRQPKEKELNNQEIIDKLIVETNGVLRNRKYFFIKDGNIGLWFPCGSLDSLHLCTTEQFTKRAKELGFANGYRWGVEYPTNGKRPDLDVDVVVYGRNYCDGCGKVDKVKNFFWNDYYKFKVVDDRYKPADTSYLNASSQDQSLTHKSADETIPRNNSDWYCYENQRALRLPDVGLRCLTWFDDGKECWHECLVLRHSPFETDVAAVSLVGKHDRKLVWADDFKPIDHAKRKAELEKRTTILAAMKACKHTCNGSVLNDLYDKGYLRLPDQK